MSAGHRTSVTVTDAQHPRHGTYYLARVVCTCGWDDAHPAAQRAEARQHALDNGAMHAQLARAKRAGSAAAAVTVRGI